MFERFFPAPFNYEELRLRVSTNVGGQKRRTMELSRWTLNNSTIPTGVMRMSLPYSTTNANDPTRRSRSESDTQRKPKNCQAGVPTPPTPRLHEIGSQGTRTQNRLLSRIDVSCVTSVAAKAIPPGCVHPPTIAMMWMKSDGTIQRC